MSLGGPIQDQSKRPELPKAGFKPTDQQLAYYREIGFRPPEVMYSNPKNLGPADVRPMIRVPSDCRVPNILSPSGNVIMFAHPPADSGLGRVEHAVLKDPVLKKGMITAGFRTTALDGTLIDEGAIVYFKGRNDKYYPSHTTWSVSNGKPLDPPQDSTRPLSFTLSPNPKEYVVTVGLGEPVNSADQTHMQRAVCITIKKNYENIRDLMMEHLDGSGYVVSDTTVKSIKAQLGKVLDVDSDALSFDVENTAGTPLGQGDSNFLRVTTVKLTEQDEKGAVVRPLFKLVVPLGTSEAYVQFPPQNSEPHRNQ